MEQLNKRPMRVTIIAWLFIAYGVSHLADMFFELSNGQLNINFAVCTLLVGIGLLYGKSSSQWWARIWFFFGYFIAGFFVVAVIFQPENTNVRYGDFQAQGREAIPYVIVVATSLAAAIYLMHYLLFTPIANAYFKRIASRKRILLPSSADAREDEPSV